MIKKFFYGMMAATMLFATSCQQDDVFVQGGEATISFQVSTPEIATRAFSDGNTATQLTYVVYDEAGNRVGGIPVGNATLREGSATVNLQLAKGNTYNVLFWAKADDANSPYTLNEGTHTLTVDYDRVASNNENLDAFYKWHKIEVKGTESQNVSLKRPFAQLNIGTADLNKAAAAGVTVAQTAVVVETLGNELDFMTGRVGGTQANVEFEMANIPARDEVFPVNDAENDYLAMNYLLVGADKTTVDVVFSYDGLAEVQTREFNNIPVQRNYRTNIYGNLLTESTKFVVTIDPEYNIPSNDIDMPDPVVVPDAANLATLLTANEEYISVVLSEDTELPITSLGSITAGSGEYKLGGVNTRGIIIDLNGKKLDITTTYWSAIGAVNEDATITIKNGTMTSTGNSAGTWNAWNVRFSNCNYVLEDVTFEKEVALDNVGKSAVLKNVTIKGSNTGDKYALWITAEGQEVEIDGLNVVTIGRGIKIDEQYVDNPQKVTLNINNATFQTEKKAAIVVKSVAGATINASNLDISKVKADKVFAVWVDEDAKDHADKVEVNGALVKVEGNAIMGVSSSEELNNALANGASELYLAAGEYQLGNSVGNTQTEVLIEGKGIENTTVKGGETSNSNLPGVYANGKHLVFKNLTYVTPNNGYQGGFGHAESVTFINCKIIGQFYAHSGAPHTFEDCIIDPLTGYLYTYGSDCVFEGCTFESSEGKALQVYEDAVAGENNVSIRNCTFKAAKVAYTWDGKPVTAIDINSNGAIFNVTVENCNATGYGVGGNSGSDLWNIKNNAQCVNLTIDGELKSLKDFGIVNGYYAVGNTYTVLTGEGFKTVATTVLADGSKNVVVELANDIDLAGIVWPAVKTSAAFTLDGNGYTIKNLTTSAVEDHGFYSTAMFTSTRKSTTIKDLVVEDATITGKGGDNSHGAVLVACNYADLSIEGVTVKRSTISNCDRTGGLVTYLYFTTATVKNCVVEDCTINSIGTAGAILGMNNSHNFTMTGCKVNDTTVSSSEGSNKAGIFIGTWQNAGTLNESGNTTENSKAINAGVETNNKIGRHA